MGIKSSRTTEEELQRNAKNKGYISKSRSLAKSMPQSMFAANYAQKVLYGDQIVHDLDIS